MAELVAQGGVSSLLSIGAFEDRLAEGDTAQLRINMRLIPPGTVTTLNALMATFQVPGGRASTEPGRVIVIDGRKSAAFLIPLAAVLVAFFVGAILLLVTSWALFRSAAPALGAGFLGLGALIVGAFIFSGMRGKRRALT